MSQQKAFTLMEMLVAIVIISILSGFVFVQMNGAINSGKDAKRQADVKLLANAIVSYSADHYSSKPIAARCTIGGGSTPCNSTIVDDALKAYITTLPNDPSSSTYYYYESDGNDCRISAMLSNGTVAEYSCAKDVVASPSAPVNGVCGTAATTYAPGSSAFTGTICSDPELNPSPIFPVTDGTLVSWTCPGSYLGSSATCTAYRGKNGVCGTAVRTTITAYPDAATTFGADTICATGTPSKSVSFPGKGGTDNWTCDGIYGGAASATCNTYHASNGVCGTAVRVSTAGYADAAVSFGADTICATGTPSKSVSFPAKGGTDNWTCGGIYGGTASATCNTYHASNGVCGTANANYYPPATTYGSSTFCALGSLSATPIFPLSAAQTWTCAGVYGATTASCSSHYCVEDAVKAAAWGAECTAAGGTLFHNPRGAAAADFCAGITIQAPARDATAVYKGTCSLEYWDHSNPGAGKTYYSIGGTDGQAAGYYAHRACAFIAGGNGCFPSLAPDYITYNYPIWYSNESTPRGYDVYDMTMCRGWYTCN